MCVIINNKFMVKSFFAIAALWIFLPFSLAVENDNLDKINCIKKAYNDFVVDILGGNSLLGKNGQVYVYDEGVSSSDYEKLLDFADLKSQLSQKYSIGYIDTIPKKNKDPGRLRSEKFFKGIYGTSAREVQKNLVAVYWHPCNCTVAFSKTSGAASALEIVGRELDKNPNLRRIVKYPNGTYNYRKIAGTDRLSMHSFGIAIDFNLPENNGYWRWTNSYPKNALTDGNLKEVVSIFESNGFIWGGKWGSFDMMHFEYRPELTIYGCSG